MDWKKILDAAGMPTLLLILFSLVANMLAGIEIVGIIAIILLFLAGLVVLGWAGLRAAKNGADGMGGAMTGALAGAVAAVVSGVISIVMRATMSLIFGDIEDVGIGLFWGVVGTLIGLVVMVGAGALFGGIGAYLGRPKKKR